MPPVRTAARAIPRINRVGNRARSNAIVTAAQGSSSRDPDQEARANMGRVLNAWQQRSATENENPSSGAANGPSTRGNRTQGRTRAVANNQSGSSNTTVPNAADEVSFVEVTSAELNFLGVSVAHLSPAQRQALQGFRTLVNGISGLDTDTDETESNGNDSPVPIPSSSNPKAITPTYNLNHHIRQEKADMRAAAKYQLQMREKFRELPDTDFRILDEIERLQNQFAREPHSLPDMEVDIECKHLLTLSRDGAWLELTHMRHPHRIKGISQAVQEHMFVPLCPKSTPYSDWVETNPDEKPGWRTLKGSAPVINTTPENQDEDVVSINSAAELILSIIDPSSDDSSPAPDSDTRSTISTLTSIASNDEILVGPIAENMMGELGVSADTDDANATSDNGGFRGVEFRQNLWEQVDIAAEPETGAEAEDGIGHGAPEIEEDSSSGNEDLEGEESDKAAKAFSPLIKKWSGPPPPGLTKKTWRAAYRSQDEMFRYPRNGGSAERASRMQRTGTTRAFAIERQKKKGVIPANWVDRWICHKNGLDRLKRRAARAQRKRDREEALEAERVVDERIHDAFFYGALVIEPEVFDPEDPDAVPVHDPANYFDERGNPI
ncbi:hypothetical protein G7Y89_g1587 [Cudoniella acicularis]|uniref:Uncharacterized protein n=1 Tax=Cudoniella acicularis TaxID=354080 RepID=A0A8H4RW32_9HELO|nr:hypothetical protein G7Y89_g1587 [Cudoniella acicularis]